jgi:hypothetical protein
MNHMSSITWGCATSEGQCSGVGGWEVEEDRAVQDDRFCHSWQLIGPNKGWHWIPKGRLSMDITYLSQ